MKKYSMNEESNPINIQSLNFRTDLAKKLEELVPEAIADGKVDVVKLKELLAEDAGEPNERFGLFWPGKKQTLRAAQEPTTATLRPAKDESKDWDTTNNIFIEGDNLEVLKVLQKQYHNSIKMIYIDPPYNTGKDFVYPDNFKEGLQNYLEFSQQVDEGNKKISTNTETAGRYHSNWLNMMYPRLKLARNLLTDDGVIFISIDDAEQANLKKICDEIFGEGNFLGSIAWRRFNSQANIGMFAKVKDYILIYARNITLVDFGRIPLTETAKKEYQYKDEHGIYARRPCIDSVRGRYIYDIKLPNGKVLSENWMITKEVFEDEDRRGLIHWPQNGGNPMRKIYLQDAMKAGQIANDFWGSEFGNNKNATEEIKNLFDGKRVFDFPKPSKLLKNIIGLGSATKLSNDDVVLDFFSGSATTAHAVMQLNAEDGGNRKYIMVQLPEPTDEKSEAFKAGYKKISDIARERINRAGEKIKADFADKLAERETPLDVGYRTYKLADTNFTKWQSAPTGDLTELQARLDLMRESSNDNASEEDLLVEVLLKMGLPLTTRTQTVDVDGLHVYQVVAEGDSTEGQPVLYLNEHVKPTLEQLRAIITDLTPSKFVILDDAFQGDNQLKTNLVQTCKSYDVELWTV
ncbi:MAG: site-specific DNA-methyltransferase [Candidatus Nanosynbacter sp. P11B_S7_bin.28.1]|nr:site-specific DNA-methyltransferase [Candidatus Nanosynbacter sp. P11B_S7_bin.28.1]